MDLPMSDVVAKRSGYSIYNDSLVAAICKMLLQRAIGPVGITNKEPKATLDKAIELRADAIVQPSDPP